MPPEANTPVPSRPLSAFRRTVLRGVGIVLPPLLTVVFFLWMGSIIHNYVLSPLTTLTRNGLAHALADVRHELNGPTDLVEGVLYSRLPDGSYVPTVILDEVLAVRPSPPPPDSGQDVYRRLVEHRYLRPQTVIPVFLIGFILAMYLVGKFLALEIGRFFLRLFEGIIRRLPLVRSVYSSVKQVTDFMFSDSDLRYTRVVAVEYPRKGAWSLGLVTSESFRDIGQVVGEPVVAVLIPFSPLPITGCTIIVPKRDTIDLDISLDQALQFVVSCGVVVPPRQLSAWSADAEPDAIIATADTRE